MARDIVFLPVALPLRPQAPHVKEEEEEEANSAETTWDQLDADLRTVLLYIPKLVLTQKKTEHFFFISLFTCSVWVCAKVEIAVRGRNSF